MCARVVKDSKLLVSEVLKDQLIVFDFPLKTFDTAWSGINYQFRHTLNGEDNVRLAFKKKNRESIKILRYEKMKPTPGQLEFTKKHYAEIKQFNKAVMNEVEQL
jgi:hypothetical protein